MTPEEFQNEINDKTSETIKIINEILDIQNKQIETLFNRVKSLEEERDGVHGASMQKLRETNH